MKTNEIWERTTIQNQKYYVHIKEITYYYTWTMIAVEDSKKVPAYVIFGGESEYVSDSKTNICREVLPYAEFINIYNLSEVEELKKIDDVLFVYPINDSVTVEKVGVTFKGIQDNAEAIFEATQDNTRATFKGRQVNTGATFEHGQDNEDAIFKGRQNNVRATFDRGQDNTGVTFERTQYNTVTIFKDIQDNTRATFEETQKNKEATFKKDINVYNIIIKDKDTEATKLIAEFSKENFYENCTLSNLIKWLQKK